MLVALVCVGLLAQWRLGAGRVDALSASELSSLSPFLVSGERREMDGSAYFIGRVGETWDYLGTSERRAVAAQVAGRLRVSGIESFSFSNARNEVLVTWRDGVLVAVVDKRGGG